MDAFTVEELLAGLDPTRHDFAEFFRSATLSLTVAHWPAESVDGQQPHRVVPVKVDLEYLDAAYDGSNNVLGNPTISLRKLPTCSSVDGIANSVAETVGNANTDDQLRWSGGQWTYNLSTNQMELGACYRIDVLLAGNRASNDTWAVIRATR
jgi:hypothetical protein